MSYFPRDLAVAVAVEPTPDSIGWEEVNCLLCGGSRSGTLVEARDNQNGGGLWFAIVQCHDCGLCYTNPRPTDESLAQFYPADYRPHQVSSVKDSGFFRSVLKIFHRDRAPLPWHGFGRLLDFGCGGGSFLAKMRTHGWQTTGLDFSAETVERVRSETGLHVLHGTLPHDDLQPESFDVITMWHSLEHVPDPKRVLTEARRLLAPKGKLIIAVPNIDSLAFRIFGQSWFGLDLPRHLTHFAPWTLHLLLERVGYRVEPIKMVRHSSWLRHSARLACRRPEAFILHKLLKGKPFSRLAAFYSCLSGQSDCMMAVATPAADASALADAA